MGLIKEPLDVDFEVDPRPLTRKEKQGISEFIKGDKLKGAKKELAKRKRSRFKKGQ
jgi:hypothetical protein